MGAFGGGALRLLQTIIYILCLLCGAVILALFSYFLAAEKNRDIRGPLWLRAVEGISGAGVLYSILAILLTCFLGGKMIFAFIGIVLDVLFAGAFIAIAIMTRHGGGSCSSKVHTPLGNGDSDSHKGWDDKDFTVSLGTACLMNKAALAVSIIGAFFFILAAIFQLWLGRHHQREKRYGPSPANNYTRGNGIKFFRRRRGAKSAHVAATKDAEAGLAPVNGHDHTHSHAHTSDEYNTPAMNAYTGNKYEAAETVPASGIPAAGGYHTGPAGSAVNPYGYDNRPTAAHNY